MKNYFEVNVVEGSNTFDLNLPTSRISGHLVDFAYEKDEIFSGRIRVNPTGISVMRGSRVGFIDADDEGHFFIDHVPPGQYVVNMRGSLPNELLRTDVEITTPENRVDIELRRPSDIGQIAGRILGLETFDLNTGKKVSVEAVSARGGQYEWGVGYWTRLQAGDDSYSLQNLPAGRYALLLSSSYSEAVPLFYTPNVEVRAGMRTNLDLEIPDGRRVKFVLDTRGTITAKKVWSLRMEDGVSIPYTQFIGSSGVSRAFMLPFGKYVVEADFGDGIRADLPIEVSVGDGVQEFKVTMP